MSRIQTTTTDAHYGAPLSPASATPDTHRIALVSPTTPRKKPSVLELLAKKKAELDAKREAELAAEREVELAAEREARAKRIAERAAEHKRWRDAATDQGPIQRQCKAIMCSQCHEEVAPGGGFRIAGTSIRHCHLACYRDTL